MARKTTTTNTALNDIKPEMKLIGGKLGIIAKAIATPKGATLEQLEKKTNWQPHTVRAALSRLRKREMVITLAEIDGRKAYRAQVINR